MKILIQKRKERVSGRSPLSMNKIMNISFVEIEGKVDDER